MPPRPLTKTPRELVITVPGIPVSVNHYVKHTKRGHRYVTPEAMAFKGSVAAMYRMQQGQALATKWEHAKRYSVELLVFLGKRQKGDCDNFPKCVLDGLVEAGAIHSDDAVYELTVAKYRDVANPRTVIKVTAW